MKASEALKKLREKGSLDEMIGMIMGDPLKRAIEALEREADAEEKAKPKVTLKEMISELKNPYSVVSAPKGLENTRYASKERERVCVAAADTLRRLDEEGGKLLLRLFSSDRDASRASGEFIRSLGVEPKP